MVLVFAIWLMIIWFVLFYKFYFLRTPTRTIPDYWLVSPANGRVIDVYYTSDKTIALHKDGNRAVDAFISDLEWPCTIISIMLTPLDVHYQRSPDDAILVSKQYFEWKYYNAVTNSKSLRATYNNENCQMLYRSDYWSYKVIQIAWKLARRIVSYWSVWSIFKRWELIWLIKFGSQVTIVFDKNITAYVKVWDYLIDGESILWTYNEISSA